MKARSVLAMGLLIPIGLCLFLQWRLNVGRMEAAALEARMFNEESDRKPMGSAVESASSVIASVEGGTSTSVSEKKTFQQMDRFANSSRLKFDLMSRYSDLRYWVSMDAHTTDALMDLLAENVQLRSGGVVGLAPLSEPAGTDLESERKIAALLGGDQFRDFASYRETEELRTRVEQIREGLEGMDVLRDDQMRPLVEALFSRKRVFLADVDGRADQEETIDALAERVTSLNDALIDEASKWLTPRQLQEFERVLADDLESASASLLMRDAVRKVRDARS